MQIAISGYETIKLYDARFTISERIGGRLIESSERWQKEQGMKGGGGGGGVSKFNKCKQGQSGCPNFGQSVIT